MTTRFLVLLAEAKLPEWRENEEPAQNWANRNTKLSEIYPECASKCLRFMCIGQSLWAIVLGFIGGVVGHVLYVKQQRTAGRQAEGRQTDAVS